MIERITNLENKLNYETNEIQNTTIIQKDSYMTKIEASIMKINSELTEKIKNQEIIIEKLRKENKILDSQTRNDKTRTNTINTVIQNTEKERVYISIIQLLKQLIKMY